MGWVNIERPGYLGKKKKEVHDSWNERFGEGNWRLVYQWGDFVVSRSTGIQIYEDGYYEFFREDIETLDWLTSTACDVYDTALTNIHSGLDYTIQETPNSHIHDIAIRRAIVRLAEFFKGDHLVHVRWRNSEGFRVNPGVVPFHLPELIVPGEIKDYGGKGIWWYENTIEDFYQRNKVLQVRA